MLKIIVTISDQHLTKLHSIAEQLRLCGMQVEEILEIVGVITGRIDSNDLAKLSSIVGVAGVEQDRDVTLSD